MNSASSSKAPSLLSLTMPVAVGYVPLGMIFGLLFVQAGGAGWLAVLSSVLVLAGAAQFMMVPMLAVGVSLVGIVLAVLIINLRHVFYGLSLLETMPAARWKRWYVIFALTDETWSVLVALPPERRVTSMTLLAALNQFWWVLGTAIGAVLGSQLQLELAGLDFALAALFAVLAVEQWRARQDVRPVWVALGAYALAAWLLPAHALTLAMALCVIAAVLLPSRTLKKGPQPQAEP